MGIATLALVAVSGAWLIATPDQDGGRQAFGTMLLVGLGVVVLVVAFFTLWGARRDKTRR